MTIAQTLRDYLDARLSADPTGKAIGATIAALAQAGIAICDLVARGALAGSLGRATGKQREVDEQKEIDVLANDRIAGAMKAAPVAALASEEMDEALILDRSQPLLVAVDPLDGSSNIDANLSIGMIFTLLPATRSAADSEAFLQPGANQLAAGFVVMGPQSALVLTVGAGTEIFTFDRAEGSFMLTHASITIPRHTTEYAINASNYRHWDGPVRTYVDDCNGGKAGPRGLDFNMRWTGSPVADIYRILSRGGIYLYPGDARKGFRYGRLRLIYEANPIAWVVEQAGGAASTGYERVLDIVPKTLHQRTPLIAGSRAEVELVERLHLRPHDHGDRWPLFSRRGLFRT